MHQLKSKLESLLFVSNRPLSSEVLAKLTSSEAEMVKRILQELQQERAGGGIVLLEAGGNWQLATNRDNTEIVTKFLNADLREKLSDATVEVLAIIAYRQPVSRSEVEAIRGVNSQYSIRHLLMRGLIEKTSNPNDARGSLYQVTTEFLQHLGITNIKDLADFESIAAQVRLPVAPGVITPENSVSESPEQPELTDQSGSTS